MTKVKRRLLVAYSCGSTFVTTTRDYLESFRQFSGWEVHYIHVTDGARITFDFSSYDALFHSYCARLCFDGYVSPSYIEAARNFAGVKMLAVQDEYDFTDKVRQAAADIGFDIFLTCVPQESWEYVYPRRMFPRTEFVHVLTGYVPMSLGVTATAPAPLAARPRRISYRGRDIGARYGRLAFDKIEIGRRMQELCAARGFETDIASDEDSRFYGDEWFRFLGSCRATLGTESGSNVFDFHGDVVADLERMTKRLGRPPRYREFEARTRDLEMQVNMGQVSPRVFEAAAMRTPMILFEGRYSGVLTPEVHYIALKKDFSNIDDVLRRLDDLPALEAMAESAYTDLVASGRYSYAAFVGKVMLLAEQYARASSHCPSAALTPVPADRMLGERLSAADLLEELPTERPLTIEWYRLTVALRRHDAIAGSLSKLLIWARREIDSGRYPDRRERRSRLTAAESGGEKAAKDFLRGLRETFAGQSASTFDDAVRIANDHYAPLIDEVVATVLEGCTALRARMAMVRAPWVMADVPALRRSKRLRERADRFPGARKIYSLMKRVRNTVRNKNPDDAIR
jgi:hypothetical protein